MIPEMKLKIPYLTVRRNKDGTVRYYFRRRGQPLAPLPDDPMSEEFAREYKRQKEWAVQKVSGAEGTFAWLCDQYMESADFKSKSDATRTARRRIIVSMARERIAPGYPETFGMEMADSLNRRHIEILRDRKVDKPSAANERLKILSQIFKLAVSRGWAESNPVRDVERARTPRGGHETATDAHIEAYFNKHRSGTARDAMVLLTSFGMRVSDLRIVGPQHVRGQHLIFKTVKTGVLCELTISQEARAIIDRCEAMVFLRTENGKAFASDKALSQRVAKWWRQAGVEGITAHSVRKWLATKMAEDGTSEYGLMAWFGWRDPKEARPYVEAANRRRMADEAGRRRSESVTRGAAFPSVPGGVTKTPSKSDG